MKYLVRISPVSRNQTQVINYLTRLLGPEETAKASELVNNGGVIYDNLNKTAADNVANQLRALGAVVEVAHATSENPQEGYRVRLISYGSSKLDVIREVRLLTGLGLRETKELVESLGEIGVYESKKDADHVKETVESVGAQAVVEKIAGNEPEPDVPGIEPDQPVEKDGFIVFGTVKVASDNPATVLTVRAWDRDLRSEQLLGETVTDIKGSYKISYTRDEFKNAEKGTADLIIRAFNFTGTLLVESEIYFNAAREQRIDLSIPGEKVIRPSQYEVLVDEITPLLDGAGIPELTNEDVWFLAQETGGSLDHIAFMADDARLAERTGIPKSVFWGLGVKDVGVLHPENREPTSSGSLQVPVIDLATLLEIPPDELMDYLKMSINEGLIPSMLADQFDEIKERFEELVASNTLESIGSQRNRLKELGKIAGLSEGKAVEFANRFNVVASDEKSWEDLVNEGVVNKQEAESLRFTVGLAEVTGNNVSLTETIRKKPLTGSGSPASSIIELAVLEQKDWENIMAENNINPPEGNSLSEYAAQLAGRIEDYHPTEVFRHRIIPGKQEDLGGHLEKVNILLAGNTGLFSRASKSTTSVIEENNIEYGDLNPDEVEELKPSIIRLTNYARTFRYLQLAEILDSDNSPDRKLEEISNRIRNLETFFENNKEKDLRTASITKLNGEEPEITFEGIDSNSQAPVKKQILAYQRTLNIAQKSDNARLLLQGGFDSAHTITKESLESFSSKLGRSITEVAPLYNNAIALADIADLVTGTLIPFTPGTAVDTSAENRNENLINALKKIDGYEDLFGSQTWCNCEHCRSIFGPAAYFVDLMRFVEEKVLRPTPGLKGHHIDLQRRRPDLWKLQLTCENTTRLLPNLTIVNEILSKYISEAESLFPAASDPAPEEIDSAVLSELRHGTRSFSQPVNIPFTELQLYLSKFDISLHQVEQAVSGNKSHAALLRLGIPAENIKVITDSVSDTGAIKRRYGFAQDVNLSEIELQKILQVTRLERSQIESLIKSDFINGTEHPRIFIDQREVEGEIQPVEEYLLHANAGRLDRLHRFVRLWRITEWSIGELDYLLGMLERLDLGRNLDRETLIGLSHIVSLQESMSLSVSELCSILENIPEVSLRPGQESHFDTLFNNAFISTGKKRLSLTNPYMFWHPPYDQESPEASADPELPRLLGALKTNRQKFDTLMFNLRSSITAARLEVEVDGTTTWRTHVELNRRNLSLLYRHKLVAGKLGLSIAELFQAMELTQSQIPPVLGRFEELSGLLEFLEWQKQADLDIGKLWLAVKNTLFSENNQFMVGEEKISELQDAIANGLDQLPEETLSVLLAEFYDLSELNLGSVIRLIPEKFNAPGTDTIFSNDFANWFASADTVEERKKAEEFLQGIAGTNFVFESLGLEESERQFVGNNPLLFGIDTGNDKPLSLESVRQIFLYRKLSSAGSSVNDTLNKLLKSGLLNSRYNDLDEQNRSDLSEMLSLITGEENNYLQSFLSILEPAGQQTGSQIDLLERLMKILKIAGPAGLNGYTIKSLISDDYDELVKAGNSLKAAIRSSVKSEEEFEKLFGSYIDQINELKRDAFTDFIITKPGLQFADTSDIYNFFLIDTEIQGCGLTSRIVEATGALQLYINRCQLNLEKGDSVHVTPGQIPDEEWEWRKNYRIWEANRKVFLYAENYIRPELRDNKSPEFKKLEERVYEEDLNEQTVEKIYRGYLDGFDDVSSLSIVGSYFDPAMEGSADGILYLIGRSQSHPVRHYLRTLAIGSNNWSPWEKIDPEMNGKAVSPVVYLNRLYLFWNETATSPQYRDNNGNRLFHGYIHTISLKFVTKNAEGIWSAPQTVIFSDSEQNSFNKVNDFKPTFRTIQHHGGGSGSIPNRPKHQKARFPVHSEAVDSYTLDSRLYNRIFPFVSNRKLYFGYGEDSKIYEILFPSGRAVPTRLNAGRSQNFGSFYSNASNHGTSQSSLRIGSIRMGLSREHFERPDQLGNSPVYLYLVRDLFQSDHHYKDAEEQQTKIFSHNQATANILGRIPASSILQPVNNHPHLYIVENDEGGAILQRTGEQMVKMTRLQTRISRDLKELLFREGLDKMLSLETQIGLIENRIVNSLLDSRVTFEHLNTGGSWVFPLFSHSYSEYIWEIFFHAPYLIADKLSSEGKYMEAESWYRYIFNPTADEVPFASDKDQVLFPKDRNWRFREFHREGITKLSEIFDANNPAYQAYRSDPFNPHAIARTRISAYQKAIVMAYINNLISWGDYLFRIDSRESIGEATLVYVMAANILGKRPPEAGACKMPAENIITYEGLDISDEFIVSLENLVLPASGYISRGRTSNRLLNLLNSNSEILNIADANENMVNIDPVHLKSLTTLDSAVSLVPLRMEYPVFCVPRNKDLLGYWDRLSDRLYKIRNCMNIDGVRRTLALFQPPIDPALLVRARAAGLSLSDVLDMHAAGLPAYRFAFLLGKARDYCGVVKSFGSALLSAFEKKDTEELQLLRSLQLQNIQKLTTNIREQQVNVARESLASLDTRRELLEYKLDYFDSKEFMNNWELTSQIIAGTALMSHTTATIMSALAPSLKVLPDWQFGTSGLGGHFVSVYGGEKLGGKAQAAAQVLRDVTTGLNMSAGMASTMGSFKRREEEWNYQKEIAKKELKLLEKETIAAEIRLAIAERSLEIHKAEMEQASEVYEYFRNKLTGFGLYSWLSSELRKVYRQSYIMALEISQLAQNGYHFERPDDNTIFIQPGYWESSRAGLLAGEKLLMSLLAMEKSYIETNHREFEIDQAFSLTQIDPAALLMLKQKGECTFEISEVFYDLFYPGQYRRKIRSVRLTIPSVTGPYTNVSATLTMTGSQIRMEPKPGSDELKSLPDSRTKTIATSTAQNDAGVFELNFMGERYMPFEGAGAVNSKWKLSLPKNFRQFDYNTINDVIIHISYTADYDELFREKVEGNIEAAEGELVNILQGSSLYRAFNLRQEFSNGFHRLTEQEAGHQVIIKIQNKHFPLFMNGRNLKVEQAKLILVTPAGKTAAGFRITVNGNIQEGFSADPDFGGLLSADMGNVFQSGIIKEHTLAIEAGGDLAPEVPAAGPAAAIDVEKLEDIILFIEYRLT